MTDSILDLLDALVFFAGLVLIIWVALRSSRERASVARTPGAVVGIIVWLAVFGFALYLVFG